MDEKDLNWGRENSQTIETWICDMTMKSFHLPVSSYCFLNRLELVRLFQIIFLRIWYPNTGREE